MTSTGQVRIEVEPFDSSVARALIDLVQGEYQVRYGGHDATRVAPDEFAPPAGLFLVAYLNGEPVACGGWRDFEGDAEIKRMYVEPSARGMGLARRILAELERAAATAGYTRSILESGTRQPEAIALYESSGYTPIPNYTIYRDEPDSRCYGKALG